MKYDLLNSKIYSSLISLENRAFAAISYLRDWHYLLQVNKNFAIKLVAEEAMSDIEARVVSCDGGGGALGHPKVYINLVRQEGGISNCSVLN